MKYLLKHKHALSCMTMTIILIIPNFCHATSFGHATSETISDLYTEEFKELTKIIIEVKQEVQNFEKLALDFLDPKVPGLTCVFVGKIDSKIKEVQDKLLKSLEKKMNDQSHSPEYHHIICNLYGLLNQSIQNIALVSQSLEKVQTTTNDLVLIQALRMLKGRVQPEVDKLAAQLGLLGKAVMAFDQKICDSENRLMCKISEFMAEFRNIKEPSNLQVLNAAKKRVRG